MRETKSGQTCRIVLVRHGASEDEAGGARLRGWYDPPLSRAGREEVRRLCAARGALGRIDAVYTSPLQRARGTAACLADALDREAAIDPRLREINCGSLDGRPIDEIERRYPELWARNLRRDDDGFRWPGGESYAEFRARVLRALAAIAAAHPGGRVVAVTHAGVITQALGAIHGAPAADWACFRASSGSVSEVAWSDGTGSLVRFDDRAHLLTPGTPPRGA